MNKILALIPVIILLGAGCAAPAPSSNVNQEANTPMPIENVKSRAAVPPLPGILDAKELENKAIRIKTDKGDIVFELYGQEAPLAASNMIWLAGHKFYDGLTWHRIIAGFMIQGGDPNGNGTGGPGYRFADEPVKRNYDEGIVAMANSGRDTNGSQFFIMLADTPGLSKDYTIFGKVTSGIDVVKRIAIGDVMKEVIVEDSRK
jgi:cyclophilin family peptidyl-prolyl cis-trans isomerase